MSSLGQRGSVGQKKSIAGFLDRVGHLGGVSKTPDCAGLPDQGALVQLEAHLPLRRLLDQGKVRQEQPDQGETSRPIEGKISRD